MTGGMKAGDDLGTVVAGIRASWAPLPDKPEETPEGIARALWLAAAGQRVSVPRAHTLDLPDLDPAAANRLQTLLARRGTGVPLAHLTERQAFMGRELLAGPGALIPRRETEILAHAALARLRALAEARGSVVARHLYRQR